MKKIILAVSVVFLMLCALCSCGDKATVSFDSNGGSEVESISVTVGEKAKEPTPPQRDGYAFIGWYLDDEKWSFNGYTVTEDITLKARWSKCLTFEENEDGTYTVKKFEPITESVVIPSTYKG